MRMVYCSGSLSHASQIGICDAFLFGSKIYSFRQFFCKKLGQHNLDLPKFLFRRVERKHLEQF